MTMGPDDERTVGPGLGLPRGSPGEPPPAPPPTPTRQVHTPAPTELEPAGPETIGPGSDGWPDEITDLQGEGFPPTGDLAPGRVLFGKYIVKQRLGLGGMGAVWLVRHRELNIDRALKLIVASHAFDDGARGWFRSEARLMAQLAHPNIVAVADARIGTESAYIEMEYVPGQSLKEVLSPGVPMPIEWVVRVAGQLCEALHAAHGIGIVHRDLKPGNLMLVGGLPPGEEQLKVLDFGIAKMLGAERADHLDATERQPTSAGVFVGTPAYASPEQIQDLDVDSRSDLYSLGVILFELLTGRRPFALRTAMDDHVLKEPPTFAEVNPGLDLPPEVEALVRRCLEKDPGRRPQTALEVSRGLRLASGLEPVPVEEQHHRISRRVLLAAVLVPTSLAIVLPLALRPSPSFAVRVEVDPSCRAGEEVVVPIVVDRARFPGPVRLRIPTLPPGLSVVGGDPGGWTIETGGTVESVRIRADLNARPGLVPLPVVASADEAEQAIEVPLTIEPPRVDLPLGFDRADGSRLSAIGPLHCPDMIVRRFEDGTEAVFLLIPRVGPGDPDPFYILRDKVSNRLFRQFDAPPSADEPALPAGVLVEDSRAPAPDDQDDWPVMNVSAREAHAFANKLGGEGPLVAGRLPTVAQWDTAAGAGSRSDSLIGPFEPAPEPDSFEGIAIGRDDPAPVGQSPRDVSPFGVRDMAGNGFEWTRNATSGRLIPLPDGRNDPIYLRGQGYTMDRPFLFLDIESEDRWRSLGYEESFYEVGFRVVIEVGAE